MMRVRAIERAGGTISIIRPVRQRRPDEPDETYYADVFGRATTNDPALADRPYVDLDDAVLPPREHRARWRLDGDRVVVGED